MRKQSFSGAMGSFRRKNSVGGRREEEEDELDVDRHGDMAAGAAAAIEAIKQAEEQKPPEPPKETAAEKRRKSIDAISGKKRMRVAPKGATVRAVEGLLAFFQAATTEDW